MADSNAANAGATEAIEAVPVGTFEQFLLFMEEGGPILYLLLVISVVALTLIIAKLFQFWMLRVHVRGFVQPALTSWHDGQVREAVGILRGERSPVARVLEVALRGSMGGAHREELIKEEITRVAGLHLDSLRGGLRQLALIANICPLIGLLGTVLGMINAFQALQDAGNKVDPSILSGGIWVALLTTAAGLIVAIPAAAAHNWMEGVVYRVQRTMEDAATRAFTMRIDLTAGGEPPTDLGIEAAQPAE